MVKQYKQIDRQLREWAATTNTPEYIKGHGGHTEWNGMKSFSQDGQDTELWGRLGLSNLPAEKSTFIEMGAFNGVGFSNTFLLESQGWRGLCIEANPQLFKDLERNRPLCTNVNAVVSATPVSFVNCARRARNCLAHTPAAPRYAFPSMRMLCAGFRDLLDDS